MKTSLNITEKNVDWDIRNPIKQKKKIFFFWKMTPTLFFYNLQKVYWFLMFEN